MTYVREETMNSIGSTKTANAAQTLQEGAPFPQWSDRHHMPPVVDMSECDGDLIIQAYLPGLNTADITVTVDGRMLVIQSDWDESDDALFDDDPDGEPFSSGLFLAIQLPERAVGCQAQASYRSDVFTAVLPLHG